MSLGGSQSFAVIVVILSLTVKVDALFIQAFSNVSTLTLKEFQVHLEYFKDHIVKMFLLVFIFSISGKLLTKLIMGM